MYIYFVEIGIILGAKNCDIHHNKALKTKPELVEKTKG